MGLEQISVRVRWKMPAYASESVGRGRRYPKKPCAAEVVTPATPHDGPARRLMVRQHIRGCLDHALARLDGFSLRGGM